MREYTKELLSSSILDIPEEGIAEIHKFSTGIPFYIQFIGKMRERRGEVTVERIKEIEEEFLREEGDILKKVYILCYLLLHYVTKRSKK